MFLLSPSRWAGTLFSLKLHVVTPMSDPDFTLNAVGKLNLGMVKDFYPLDKGTNLNGLLDMNLNAGGKTVVLR